MISIFTLCLFLNIHEIGIYQANIQNYQKSSEQLQKVIDKGLNYLASEQNPDGSYSHNGQYTMAMTALSGIAFLSSGSTLNRGVYQKNLSSILSFILKQTSQPSFKKIGFLTTPNEGQPMYGHGFACLFLAQIYGAGSDPKQNAEIRKVLRKSVTCISRAQGPQGGWYYSPFSSMDEGSVTITQLQALRAAQNSGIAVNEDVIKRSLNYLRRSQNNDGGIRYRVGSPGLGSPALTAAGIACFFNCGIYSGQNVDAALAFINRFFLAPKDNKAFLNTQRHFMYTHQYASQVYFYLGGERWERYFKKMSNYLIKSQKSDGSWLGSPGPAYATPVALMILTLPYGFLPINQR